MMRQYLEIKKSHPDTILFFRMGDFYEMFLEDAETAAPLMDIALTRRQNSVPMAGVPFHSVDTYIARLIGAGQKVAIAEQEVDPANPKLMRRKVRRIVTPGTLVEDSLLQSASHNYLMSIVPNGDAIGLALADVSTGDFFTLQVEGENEQEDQTESRALIRDLYFKYGPREILVPTEDLKDYRDTLTEAANHLTPMEDWKASPTEGKRRIDETYGANLRGLGYDDDSMPALGAASLILHYISSNFPGQDIELSPPAFHRSEDKFMLLDEQTIRNLDLVYNYQEGGATRTLYSILNFCKTPSGKRRLKEAILTPLLQKEDIELRLNMVSFLSRQMDARDKIIDALASAFDLERVLGRMSSGRGAPRDFLALGDTVAAADTLLKVFAKFPKPDYFPDAGEKFTALVKVEKTLRDIAKDIKKRIRDEAPATLGGAPLLREGIDPELDKARGARDNGAKWVLEFEAKEKERTGLTSLKVKYNRVVGYFIEISKAQAKSAPDDYQRKQTLVGNERFTCERLKELEESILQSDDIIDRIEEAVFKEITEKIVSARFAVKTMMGGVAEVDFLASLALAAMKYGWICPAPTLSGELIIEEGRHPVVEKFLGPGESFIPNNVKLDAEANSFAVLTGPNMAGKSTYIRQIAIIQLLMQIGSFVPARHATLSVVDRIFTRIGASDNLTRGESTFFVEMLECARILNQATDNSLVIMDEVGRGTSTYDGLSIAWSVVEYFTGDLSRKPRVLFATHYHELTALEKRPGVFNLTMDVQEADGRVIFMHRVRSGPADRSYGVHVARLAGLPVEVTDRAQAILAELEEDYSRQKSKESPPPVERRKKSKAKKSRKSDVSEDQGSLF